MGNPSNQIATMWNVCARIPIGRWLFSRFIGWKVPYSGTIPIFVVDVKPGYAKLELKDCRRIRNHLNSIHAIALVNFGELTSGLALTVNLPQNIRAIVTSITINYVKKARGKLTSECRIELPIIDQDMEFIVHTLITDNTGEQVANVHVTWKLGPIS